MNTKKKMYALGVDIGSTNIKFVLLKESKVFKKRKILTPKSRDKLIKVLEENIKELVPQGKIRGIGIGVPGPLNKKRDFILNPPNLKCLANFSLAKKIEKDLKIKTRMENDVNCFSLAEASLGAARKAKIIVGLTLGTGVGGGIVQRSNIYKGAFGSAGEIGHMTIKFDGNNSGSLEEYCSEKFFKRKNLYSKNLDEKAKRGDKKALKTFEEYGRYLGIGIANIINVLDPEAVVIGGGISKASKFFLKTAKQEVKKRVFSPLSKKSVKIKMAKFKDFAGAIGAALIIENGE